MTSRLRKIACQLRPTPLALALVGLWCAAAWSGEPLVMPLWPDQELGPNPESMIVQRGQGEGAVRWLPGTASPQLAVYLPEPNVATGAAIVVCPGGGYAGQAIGHEGHDVARWLADRGVLGVVLNYRCGGGDNRHPIPMQDAQRAIQTVRHHAERWGVDRSKVGVLGFSAGGHLAATAATQWSEAATGGDPVERWGTRPDSAILVYPVISMRADVTHAGSRRNLLGESPGERLVAALSADERVTPETPPMLLVHSADDTVVSVENSLRFWRACVDAGVEADLHVYPTGGHGYGFGRGEGSANDWPRVMHDWLARRGWATPTE